MTFEEWWEREDRVYLNEYSTFKIVALQAWKHQQERIDELEAQLEEHDRYELEQAIMSCWGITDDLKLLADAMDGSLMHDEMLMSIITLYHLKFENLFKEFEKFTRCYL